MIGSSATNLRVCDREVETRRLALYQGTASAVPQNVAIEGFQPQPLSSLPGT